MSNINIDEWMGDYDIDIDGYMGDSDNEASSTISADLSRREIDDMLAIFLDSSGMIRHSLQYTMKKLLLEGVSIRKYNIRSESLEIINIIRSKAEISDQALANHSRRSMPPHKAEKIYHSSRSECIQQGLM